MTASFGDATEQPVKKEHLVEVALETKDGDGATEVKTLSIESGPTKVEVLMSELGVADALSLWVIKRDGKPKPLAPHETHDVKAGDRYQALVPGGVS
jgi:hypothetical protein